MRFDRLVVLASLAAATLTLPAIAEQRFLELDPSSPASGGTSVAPIGVCTILHEVYPSYCDLWHVIAVLERAEATPVLSLENKSGKADFAVDWMGPNYLLESGEMVAPVGSEDKAAVGATWIEVWPHAGRSRAITGWSDRNGDGKVGALDAVTLDGGAETTIRDVRTILSVSRVSK